MTHTPAIPDDRTLDELTQANTGFTRTELTEAFNKVCNVTDWKARIQGFCSTEEVRVVAAAVEFFTATPASFFYIGPITSDPATDPSGRYGPGVHLMAVTALGYREGPAGDH